jgi:hypothetical protein
VPYLQVEGEEEIDVLINLALLPDQLVIRHENWLHDLACSLIIQAYNDMRNVGSVRLLANKNRLPSRLLTISREAQNWVEDTTTRYCLSFENCCGILDINPDWLRRKMLEGL